MLDAKIVIFFADVPIISDIIYYILTYLYIYKHTYLICARSPCKL